VLRRRPEIAELATTSGVVFAGGGLTLETAMAAKQKGQKDKQSGKQKQQEANLGQKEAGQEKEKQSKLSSMGEMSRASSPDTDKGRLDK
jgi:hypothetical protein